MAINIETLKVGDKLTLTDGGLSDTGKVVAIDYDENMISIEVPTSMGTDIIEVDPDEPGLAKADD